MAKRIRNTLFSTEKTPDNDVSTIEKPDRETETWMLTQKKKARGKPISIRPKGHRKAESSDEKTHLVVSTKNVRPKMASKTASVDSIDGYFQQIHRLPLLSAAAEYELARRISILEEALWVQILSFAPLTAHWLDVLSAILGKSPPENVALRKNATQLCVEEKTTGKELSTSAGRLATKLRQVDLDREMVGAVLEEFRSLGKTVDKPPSIGALPEKTWQNYVQGTFVLHRLIANAKQDFVKANLRLVVSVARRFAAGRLPMADLVQEGNLGLIKAVERFDYRRGFRFSTYATWWIRHAVAHAVASKSRVVRLPIHMVADLHSIVRHKQRLSLELGRPPTGEELAVATGLKKERIAKADLSLIEEVLSLDVSTSPTERKSLGERIEDECLTPSTSERLISEGILREVENLLGNLTEMEKDILRLRFGLDGDEERTFSDIADKYQLSKERIRQIHERAILRLRRSLVRKGLA